MAHISFWQPMCSSLKLPNWIPSLRVAILCWHSIGRNNQKHQCWPSHDSPCSCLPFSAGKTMEIFQKILSYTFRAENMQHCHNLSAMVGAVIGNLCECLCDRNRRLNFIP